MPGSSSFSFDPLSSYFRTSQPLTDPLAPRRLPQGDVCCASKVSPRTLETALSERGEGGQASHRGHTFTLGVGLEGIT